MKICGKCKINKDNSEFGTSNQTSDGLRWECNLCRQEDYYKNHDKMIKQKRRDYESHKESRLKKLKEKYENDIEFKESKIRNAKQYYYTNKEIISERTKKYREKNKEDIALRKKGYTERKKREELIWIKNNIITVEYPKDKYKICSKCQTLKEIELFNKKRATCKECQSIEFKKYHKKHRDFLNNRRKEYSINNQEKEKARKQKYRESEYGKQKTKEYKNQKQVKIADRLRACVRRCVKFYHFKKQHKTFDYLGCDIDFLLNI